MDKELARKHYHMWNTIALMVSEGELDYSNLEHVKHKLSTHLNNDSNISNNCFMCEAYQFCNMCCEDLKLGSYNYISGCLNGFYNAFLIALKENLKLRAWRLAIIIRDLPFDKEEANG